MNNVISSFESDSGVKTAVVYLVFDVYLVVYNDRKERIFEKKQFSTLQEAEDSAEDWVLDA